MNPATKNLDLREIRETILDELQSALKSEFSGNDYGRYGPWSMSEKDHQDATETEARALAKAKEQWSDDDVLYIYKNLYTLQDRFHQHQGDGMLELFAGEISLDLAELIVVNLPHLLSVNKFEEIPVNKKFDVLEDLVKKIDKVYSTVTEEKGKVIAVDNLRRVPLDILTKETISALPTENYEFYRQLIPLCSSFEDFNALILRKDGPEKQYYQELFGIPELKKLGDVGNLDDIIARISRHDSSEENIKAWEFIFHALAQPSLLEKAFHLYQQIGGSTRFGLTAHKIFPFKVHENPEQELARYRRFFDAVENKKTGIDWPYVQGGSKILQLQHRNTWLRGLFTSSFLRGHAILDLFRRWHDTNKYQYEKGTRKKLNALIYDHWVKSKAANEPYYIDKSIVAAFSEVRLESLLRSLALLIPKLGEQSDAFYAELMKGSKLQELPSHLRGKDPQTIEKLEYFLEELGKDQYFEGGATDELRNALHRILTGLRLPVNVDQFCVEANPSSLFDLVNIIDECTSVGGKFEAYGYAQAKDKHIGIIAANLYYHTVYQETVGKAFLVGCKDEGNKKILLVDGVVMQQDIAELLPQVRKEPVWMRYFTWAITEMAMAKEMKEIIFNFSHSSAQRSVWQYCRHIADFLGLQEGRDYLYRENPRQVMTTSEEGFQLTDETAKKNLHYLEKIVEERCPQEHFLAGFWINYWDPAQDGDTPKKTYSPIPTFVSRQHKEQPYINNGKGQVIGFKISTAELNRLLKEKNMSIHI